MKLLLCPHCMDIRELRYRRVYCSCRKSWGRYEHDGHHAVLGGDALCIGLDSRCLYPAVHERQRSGRQQTLACWLMGEDTPTLRRES